MLTCCKNSEKSAEENSGPLSVSKLQRIQGRKGKIWLLNAFIMLALVLLVMGTAATHFE
jgi:hypothetical protein